MRRALPALLVLLLLLPSAAAVTLVRYEANTVTSGMGYAVYGGQVVAQSFTATENYTLARLALRVWDVGTDDRLYVALVADEGGIPGGGPGDLLATASNNTGSGLAWANFDLTPHVKLTRGSAYWIVANNSAINANEGYGWERSNGNTYADGYVAYNKGSGWFLLTGDDMLFQNFGYLDADVRPALRASPAAAGLGDRVNLTVSMNNTGGETATRVWLNLTIPGEVRYLSDTAAALGGLRTGDYNWTFANLAPGNHSFQVEVRLVGGLGGDGVRATARLDFAGAQGALFRGRTASGGFTVLGPRFAPRVTVAPAFPRRGDLLAFTVAFDNGGNEAAGLLWLNHTLPATGVYLGDTANGTGLVTAWSLAGRYLNLTMANVPPGPHAYTITVGQQPGLPGGTEFPLALAHNYTDTRGNSLPGGATGAVAVLKGPHLTLALGADRAFATPRDLLALRLDYGNKGSGITLAQDLYVNLTLSPWVALVNATPGYDGSLAPSGLLSWYFPTLAAGASGTLRVNATVAAPLADGTVLAFATVATLRDDIGIRMPDVYANATLLVRVPLLVPAAALDPPGLEVGSIVNYTLRFNNTGSGTAQRLWVNVTLGAGLAFSGFDVAMSSGLLVNFQPSSNELRFVFVGVGPGAQALLIRATAVGALANGTRLAITATLAYRDMNGNPAGSAAAPAAVATVRAPDLRGALALSRARASVGDDVRFDIAVVNRGLATARDYWVNLTLDASLVPLLDDAGVPRETLGPRASWHFRDLLPGETRRFSLTVRVGGSALQDRLLEFVLTTEYTDGGGNPLGEDRAPAVTLALPAAVGRAPSPQELLLLGSTLAAIALLLALVVQRFREPSVEEVLLIHREGLLLAQASRARPHGKDRDILAGSLVAIQAFIKDAFEAEAEKELERMDLGDYKILIRRGSFTFLVAALKGSPTRRTVARLEAALRRLEAEHADLLAHWMGNMDEIEGLRGALEQLLSGRLAEGPEALGPPPGKGEG